MRLRKAISTVITREQSSFGIQYGNQLEIIRLVSRPLGGGLIWYFRIAATGKLYRTLYFNGERHVPLYHQCPVYVSQYQSRAHRLLIRLRPLIQKIDGDSDGCTGPARGKSRTKKIASLQGAITWLMTHDRECEKVLAKWPDFADDIAAGRGLLNREKLKRKALEQEAQAREARKLARQKAKTAKT